MLTNKQRCSSSQAQLLVGNMSVVPQQKTQQCSRHSPVPHSFTQLDGPAAQCPHTELQMLLNVGVWGTKRRFQAPRQVMFCNSIPEREQKLYLFAGDGAPWHKEEAR